MDIVTIVTTDDAVIAYRPPSLQRETWAKVKAATIQQLDALVAELLAARDL